MSRSRPGSPISRRSSFAKMGAVFVTQGAGAGPWYISPRRILKHRTSDPSYRPARPPKRQSIPFLDHRARSEARFAPHNPRVRDMATGTVKWFNDEKGFGF